MDLLFENKMYGNCLSFAIYDLIKNGGQLIMSFSKYQRLPHFSVQRNGNVYDLEIITMLLKEFFYYGEIRITPVNYYDHIKCKRYGIFSINKKE